MTILLWLSFLLTIPGALTWYTNRDVKWILNKFQKATEEVDDMQIDNDSDLFSLYDRAVEAPGTPKDLQTIIIKRCKDYQNMHKELFKSGPRNCERIYSMLEAAIIQQPGCGVNEKYVTMFMKMTETDLPKDKQMFWSKTKDLAKVYSNDGKKVFTLETSFVGYILDDLIFCGPSIGSGINYKTCPDWQDCNNNHPLSVFWKSASKQFATKVKGQFYVLLNGSLDEKLAPFEDTSIFGSVEIPNLNCKVITNVNIWVIHTPGKPAAVVERCGGPSLTILSNTLERKGCKNTCTDDPREMSGLVGKKG